MLETKIQVLSLLASHRALNRFLMLPVLQQKEKSRDIPTCLRLDSSLPRKKAISLLVFLFSSVLLKQDGQAKEANDKLFMNR